MIKNKFVGAIAAAAVVAFITIPVTANASTKKHACYGLEACKDKTSKHYKHCKDGAMMKTEKQCKKMHGTTEKPADKE